VLALRNRRHTVSFKRRSLKSAEGSIKNGGSDRGDEDVIHSIPVAEFFEDARLKRNPLDFG